jgi:hypothetical protein
MGFSMFESAVKFAVVPIVEKYKDRDLSTCELEKNYS